jgi:hypothetical protein
MNALIVAIQGLGYSAAQVALQGLLAYVALEVQKYEQGGGGGIGVKRKTKRHTEPLWLPKLAVEDEEAMLLVGLI